MLHCSELARLAERHMERCVGGGGHNFAGGAADAHEEAARKFAGDPTWRAQITRLGQAERAVTMGVYGGLFGTERRGRAAQAWRDGAGAAAPPGAAVPRWKGRCACWLQWAARLTPQRKAQVGVGVLQDIAAAAAASHPLESATVSVIERMQAEEKGAAAGAIFGLSGKPASTFWSRGYHIEHAIRCLYTAVAGEEPAMQPGDPLAMTHSRLKDKYGELTAELARLFPTRAYDVTSLAHALGIGAGELAARVCMARSLEEHTQSLALL